VKESVYAADQLFATLDPTMRRLEIDNYGEIVLSDTVGFIQDLPHTLVAAFHSTLEEVKNSSILLHIVDRANPEYRTHIDEVNLVLQEIGADEIPMIQVFNKVDLIDKSPALKRNAEGEMTVLMSAQENLGLDLLNDALYELLTRNHAIYEVELSIAQEKLRSNIHSRFQVLDESFDEHGSSKLKLHLSPRELGWLEQKTRVINLSRSQADVAEDQAELSHEW
jgi:GTP-binding protein HflX